MTSKHMTRLLLVRHGQSEWNAEGRWQGQADSPLSELGRKQAFFAADRVGSVDSIVSSPQKRALESATIISNRIGVGPVQVIDGLEERSAGEWSGLTPPEIEAQWPGWIAEGRRPDSFENDESVRRRVFAALDRIVAELAGADILVVCHSGIIRFIESDLGCFDGPIANLGGRAFAHDGSRLVSGDRMELLDESIITGDPGHIV